MRQSLTGPLELRVDFPTKSFERFLCFEDADREYPNPVDGKALSFWKHIDSILRDEGIIRDFGIENRYRNHPFQLNIGDRNFKCRLYQWGMSWMAHNDLIIKFYYHPYKCYHNGKYNVGLCVKIEFFSNNDEEAIKFILCL